MVTRPEAPRDLDLLELTKQTLLTTSELVETQLALVRAELDESLGQLQRRVALFGVSLVCAGAAVSVFLVAAGLAIGNAIGHPALVMCGVALTLLSLGGVTFVIGVKRQMHVFGSTRKHCVEEIEWAKKKFHDLESETSPNESTSSAIAPNP